MSHKATNWLSSLPAETLGNSEFRVLFHLCDCHNPANGCFPTQAYLLEVCAVSNGTLNNALNALETKGMIERHRVFDGVTKRQKPTRYMLGFEKAKSPDPTPKTGDGKSRKQSTKVGAGKSQKPTPKTGDGADSNLGGDPTPTLGVTRLQPTGEVTCKEPVINQSAASETLFFTADERFEAEQIGKHINGGGSVSWGRVPDRIALCLDGEKLVKPALVESCGLAEKVKGLKNG